ncbi:MAG: hypothetical protein V4568_19580 [Pseudomonadota bacterium]
MFIAGTTFNRRSVGVLLGESSLPNRNSLTRPADCVLLRQSSDANAQSDCSAMVSASVTSDEGIIHHG